MIKLLSFDIDDTVAESKQPVSPKMAKLLAELSYKYYLHFTTGGALGIVLQNLITPLKANNANLENILSSPNIGALLIHFNKDGTYKTIYEKPISEQEFKRIKQIFEKALQKVGHNPEKVYGEMIEYRKYSITFSALGQKAPLEIKSKYDPTREKRKQIIKHLTEIGDKYQIAIAGKSSIDISYKGVNKGYALQEVQKYLGLTKDEILFFGDSLGPDGNDYPVKQAGFNTVEVRCWQDTYELLQGYR